MSRIIELPLHRWDETITMALQQKAVHELEQDNILFFPALSFVIETEEAALLSPQYSDGKAKNISYNCNDHTLRGIDSNVETAIKMKAMLSRFNRNATRLINQLFPHYEPYLQVARTSYRPVEIAGRKAKSYKKDDTRLHIDAFPSSPVQGRRLLRVFSNINPFHQLRVWHVGESFEGVANRFLPQIRNPFISGSLLKKLKITKGLRTPYDHFMLHIHDRMKADTQYQKTVPQITVAFPANSTWIVQTDSVSHAVLSGQFLMEQTFYLPVEGMVNPNQSPLRILEKLRGRALL